MVEPDSQGTLEAGEIMGLFKKGKSKDNKSGDSIAPKTDETGDGKSDETGSDKKNAKPEDDKGDVSASKSADEKKSVEKDPDDDEEDGVDQFPALTSDPPPMPSTHPKPRSSYGFKQAVELMRVIPVDENQKLVVQVVKRTLESANISVSEIIKDAERQQREVKARVEALKQAISHLQQEIAAHKKDVVELEKENAEINRVKELLLSAESLRQQRPQERERTQPKERPRSTVPPAPARRGTLKPKNGARDSSANLKKQPPQKRQSEN